MTIIPIKLPTEDKKPPTALGYYVAVEIWVSPDKIGNVHIPSAVQKEDLYSRPVGRVISVGPDCYKGDLYVSGPWCAVGDWVLFDRPASIACNYFGTACCFVPDNKIVANIPDPNQYKKINA